MGKYDEERKKLGLNGSTSSVSTAGTSKYAQERQRIINPTKAKADDNAYVSQMKNARLQEVANTKEKKANEDAAAIKFLTDNKLDLYSQAGERFKQDQAQKFKENEIETAKQHLAMKGEVAPNEKNFLSGLSYMERVRKVTGEAPALLQPLVAPLAAIAEAPAVLGIGQALGNTPNRDKVTGGGKAIGQFIAPIGTALTTPGGLLGGGTIYNASGNLLTRYAPKLSDSALGRLSSEGIKGAAVGAPTGAGSVLAANPEASNREILEGAAYGVGGGLLLGTLGRVPGELAKWGKSQIRSGVEDVAASQLRGINALDRASSSPQYSGNLRLDNKDQSVSRIMGNIKDEVTQAMTPPLENEKALRDWVKPFLDNPSNKELSKLTHQDLTDIANEARKGMNTYDTAVKVAKHRGINLEQAFEQSPSIRARVAQDASRRAYGIDAPELPNVSRPIVNEPTTRPVSQESNPSPVVEASQSKYHAERQAMERPVPPPVPQPIRTTEQPIDIRASETTSAPMTSNPIRSDELRFAHTVRNSENTAQPLVDALNETPMVGARTTDVLNRQQAANLIERHGMEGLYGKLMGKTKQFSAAETTAAQILAKQYSSLGGDENLSKAIDLASKTAKGGREMGQAIQALSQWNKLDVEGALLLGERQLNRGVGDTANWQKLTVEQGAPIKEAAQRFGSAQETRNLADEVLNIVTAKQTGEALTEAEKATIKQFHDQIKLINEKGRGILPKPRGSKANETIREVSRIEPRVRTRDQVVSFLDAKADKARQRLAASRNKLSSTPFDTYTDYAIIGASHIAKGAVKLTDFTTAMVRDFGESVRPKINEIFTKSTNIFRKENGLPTVEQLDRVVRNAVKNERFTPQEAEQFKAWASEIGHMSNDFKIEATQDLQAAMKELGDSTLGQKLATIQTGAQLLNAVTIGRNVLGNTALIVSEKVNKVSAVPIDWAFSKMTGERTIKWLPQTQEKMFQNFMKGTGSGWKGVSPTGTLDSYGIHPNVFGKKNPLKYISKALGASMQGFDFAAYRVAYGDVLATYGEQLGKAQNLTKSEIRQQMPKLIEQLDQRIHDLADKAGRYATFQDETLLSDAAELLKRGLNKITDLPAQKLVEKGIISRKYSTEGFGAGDILVKYAKTPANLIMRAIDYSPMGFLRATYELAPLVFNRANFNQFQATRALSRAITGTLGLTGMGYVLADAGILTGSSSMDKDVRSIQEQSGQGAYKVNWSALGRFITSGFDYDEAKYKKGDRLMDYQWLQPAAISVAMGVNANKAMKDRKNGEDISGWQVAQKSLLGGLQTVLENPMVQGISNVVDASSDIIKRQDTTKLRNIGRGVPATFVPTLLNQWRAATDNKQRETFSKNLLTEMGNLMKNKIPGLSKTLPVSYDSLGNARERIQGGKENSIEQYLTAFFSPARMTEYQVTPEAKLVLDLMDESGNASVLPRIGNKSFHVKQGKNIKDLKVSLTAEQFSQYQQNLGTMVSEKLSQQSEYLSNPNVSLEKKVKKVTDILTAMGKKAREDIGTEMGYQKKDIKS